MENYELQLAYNFVQYTDRNIFLTGKAGTGKTTFLHYLKKTSLKRMAVVAPTGVAAINAGGVTIHSFFQMPFGPYISQNVSGKTDSGPRNRKFNSEKINLLRSLDLLVIDEISMVRADLLDGIDDILRRYKNHTKPFGGIQLLMIGDLHQLSPVIKGEDWALLKDFYPNLYFFSSKALQQTSPLTIELKHIYRQSDINFIDLLNSVRENKITKDILSRLNQRYIHNFTPGKDEGYIILTTHNHTAEKINDSRLSEIKAKSRTFRATVSNDFPEYAYPAVYNLELKVGAQVMFIKNDSSQDKLFYNGKIGKVITIKDDVIFVQCADQDTEIAVYAAEWQNIKYELNSNKEIEETVAGTFTQFPLKLAWAITIHKSQGLTFEKAIIDAGSSFAHGQVYVALSRCKSFEGLVLRSPIEFNSIKTDGTVSDYTRDAHENEPGEEHLSASKISFQQSLLIELFDFTRIRNSFFYCKKVAEDNDRIIAPAFLSNLNELKTLAENKIFTVAETFTKQLAGLFARHDVPEENTAIQERVQKASVYFTGIITELIYKPVTRLSAETDNKAVMKIIAGAVESLRKDLFIKLKSIEGSRKGFNTTAYLQDKANAEIDFELSTRPAPASDFSAKNTLHAQLYATLKKWRDDLANENRVPVFHVLPQKVMTELVTKLPATSEELEAIKGLGKIKVKHFGPGILAMINSYCENNNIDRVQLTITHKQDKPRTDSKKVSFDLYQQGKSITKIAAERGFSPTTIEGHLAHYIGTGEIDIFSLISKEKVGRVKDYLVTRTGSSVSLNELKAAMSDDYSYGELRAITKYLGTKTQVGDQDVAN